MSIKPYPRYGDAWITYEIVMNNTAYRTCQHYALEAPRLNQHMMNKRYCLSCNSVSISVNAGLPGEPMMLTPLAGYHYLKQENKNENTP